MDIRKILLLALVTEAILASEFRSVTPISGPGPLPEGAVAMETFQPVDPEMLEKELKKMAANYTKPELANFLGEGFYDAQRLLDTISEIVPRDAELSLKSPLRGVQTLQQYKQMDADGKGYSLVSSVSVIAETRLRFNSPTAGATNLDGTNEFVLEVNEHFDL